MYPAQIYLMMVAGNSRVLFQFVFCKSTLVDISNCQRLGVRLNAEGNTPRCHFKRGGHCRGFELLAVTILPEGTSETRL